VSPQQQQQQQPQAGGPAKGSDVPRINIGVFGVMNAGKSTLMNAITRQETSIVDATPGTTAGALACLLARLLACLLACVWVFLGGFAVGCWGCRGVLWEVLRLLLEVLSSTRTCDCAEAHTHTHDRRAGEPDGVASTCETTRMHACVHTRTRSPPRLTSTRRWRSHAPNLDTQT
jgi:GTPase SAR1 family protein